MEENQIKPEQNSNGEWLMGNEQTMTDVALRLKCVEIASRSSASLGSEVLLVARQIYDYVTGNEALFKTTILK